MEYVVKPCLKSTLCCFQAMWYGLYSISLIQKLGATSISFHLGTFFPSDFEEYMCTHNGMGPK